VLPADVPLPFLDETGTQDILVLHVEDDTDLGEIVKAYLERTTPELTVVSAGDVNEGRHLLENEDVDCIVSDYDMPGTNGLDFLEEVRVDHPRLPFILYTGKGSEEVASDAIAAGVTDYMQKDAGTGQYGLLANRIVNAVERYRAREDLMDAFSWYRRLVEQNLAGIYVVQDEQYQYVNEKFASIFGYEQEDLIGAGTFEVVDEAYHDLLRENLKRRESGEVESLEYTLVGKRKDDTRIEVSVHGGLIHLGGEPAVMGVLLDASEASGSGERG